MSITKEEAIRLLSRYDTEYYTPATREAHRMGIQALKEHEQRRWIPVKESPKESGEYLTKCHHHRNGDWWEVVPFDADKGYFVDLGKHYYPYVTHWMPLPDAPKEVE